MAEFSLKLPAVGLLPPSYPPASISRQAEAAQATLDLQQRDKIAPQDFKALKYAMGGRVYLLSRSHSVRTTTAAARTATRTSLQACDRYRSQRFASSSSASESLHWLLFAGKSPSHASPCHHRNLSHQLNLGSVDHTSSENGNLQPLPQSIISPPSLNSQH